MNVEWLDGRSVGLKPDYVALVCLFGWLPSS